VQVLVPWQRVQVEGYSMTPSLLPGDWLLVRHGATVRTGQIVLGEFRSRPDLLVIKRVAESAGDDWLLASDNAEGGSDSRHYGPARVLAVAVWHWPTGRLPATGLTGRLNRLRHLIGGRPPGGIAHV
jgi:hypothetical protein